jgi:hypothetical protein
VVPVSLTSTTETNGEPITPRPSARPACLQARWPLPPDPPFRTAISRSLTATKSRWSHRGHSGSPGGRACRPAGPGHFGGSLHQSIWPGGPFVAYG